VSRERIFVNGKVFTGRNEHEFVSAFAVRDGKFTLVGDVADASDAEVVDLEGRTVVPGFVDVHTHPTYIAMTRNAVPCTVPVVHSIPEMIEALKRHPNYGKGDHLWIEGFGYDESKLVERRTPTTRDLDQVSTTQPVYVMRSDCHSGVCNTRALELAGITRDTPDPEGGRFGRYENGEPNGFLEEHAANDVVRSAMAPQSWEKRVDDIVWTSRHFAERGIVAVSELMGRREPVDVYRLFADAERHGFRQQAGLYIIWPEEGLPDLTGEERTGRIKVAGVKVFVDGTISARTAWVGEAYRGTEEYGYPTISDDALEAAYRWAVRNRVQLAAHAMGDRAIERVLDFFADKEPWLGPDVPSVRIEHATLITPDQLRRVREAKMRFGGTMQVIFFFAEHESYAGNLTDAQYRRAYAVKDAAAVFPYFALTSDAPCTTWSDPDDVFVSIQAAVTRKAYNGADIVAAQAITVPQAVLLYTARAAALMPYEGKLGRIAPGYEASFVVLDRDLFTQPVEAIAETRVAETWIRGEKVFEREA